MEVQPHYQIKIAHPIGGGNPPASPLRTALKGAVGITKAALHVDRAAEPLIRQRRAICAARPKATAGSSKTSRCTVCTCFIHSKSATASEKCPEGRW
jgi:hypothetical protein